MAARPRGRPRSAGSWRRRPAARGIATEAARALLELGFEELGFHRIDAKLDALNTASAGLCERLGMRLEATLVDNWHYKGAWATELIYAMLAEEWRAAELARSRCASATGLRGQDQPGQTSCRARRAVNSASGSGRLK